MKVLAVLSLGIAMLSSLSLRTAKAQVINYPNGFAGSANQIWLENSTVLAGPVIQLTQSGATGLDNNAWYETPVNVQAFTTTFTFTETCPNNCGEGFGFMIISVSNPSSGYTFSAANGPQFSWSQCGGTGDTSCQSINSILVKFDLYDELTGSSGANTTGFYSGGTYPQPPNNPQYDMAPSGINMQSGDLMRATLWYNGSVLTEIVSDTVTGATFTNSYTADIPSLVGGNTAYVGFGGSTGAATATQGVSSWTYTIESPGQAAVPMFSPAAGTYFGSQSISLSSASSGAVICYNTTGSPATNGSTGCTAGTVFTGPIAVPSGETLYAVAGGTGYTDSPLVSANYVIQSAVSPPDFSPAAGTYNSSQSITISDVTSNANIFFTTDGTAPTAASSKYTGPITVGSTETLKAIAVAAGNTASAVSSAAYTINAPTTVAPPVFSPPAGTYTSAQSVNIADATSGATIYYTTDGTTPTGSSSRYNGPITISTTETLQAIAMVTGNIESTVATAAYTVNLEPSVALPIFSPAGGVYTSAQSVTISDATANATIYYTTDGTVPTTSSMMYTGPITVNSTETLKAQAVATGDNNSAVAAAAYNITPLATVATPALSPAAGTYTAAQSVSISDATVGATIYYTTNGTAPTASSTMYTGPITVSSTETVNAIAVASGETISMVASATYTISAQATVATPAFLPAAGTYTSAQRVTISDATSGATIYYTTDGSAPTASSTQYTGPITVSATETVDAIAIASGYTESMVASAAYVISSQAVTATPTFTPAAGTYTSAQSITISDGTPGATIYYTTNGSLPTTSSTQYASPITVSSTETLQAIAVAMGDSSSALGSADYTIASLPSFTLKASSASLTADPGSPGTLTLTVTPENGFDSPVSFACSGLPAGATCSFSPATVTTSGAAAATQLTIAVSEQSSAVPSPVRPFLPLTALAFTVGLWGWGRRPRRHRWLLVVTGNVLLGFLFGCGGSGGGATAPTPTPTPAPTPAPTTSTVTITATSGTLKGTAAISLVTN